jgi:predicted small lipoprotein YifL
MYRFLRTNLMLAFALYALSGCYPKGPEYYDDLDLTITDYDPDYNFGAQQKYFMPDTVSFTTNIKDLEIDDKDVQNLLNEIETNFTQRGYTRLDAADIEDAEFVIGVNIITVENNGVGWTPIPPYYPGWGWGGIYYPPYWGAYYSYSYTTGSVIVEWFDPQEPPKPDKDGNELQPVHWVAALNGLVSSAGNSARVEAGINQAFVQSPYIQSK